jgi:exodeoxyribonuclease-5
MPIATSPGSSSVELTSEQREAMYHLLSLHGQVRSLGGYAGTGKTTVVRHLCDLLPGHAVCAFTGKAADVLRRKGVDASTIHSLIYWPEEVSWYDEDGNLRHDVEWTLKPPDKVDGRGFIVDEASMVSAEVFCDLLSYGRPIILVGDHGQLPPVSRDAFNPMLDPDVTLETIHRNAGEIARFADFVRRGNVPGAWPSQKAATGKEVQIVPLRELCELEGDPDQTICAFNKTRVMLNREAREYYGYPPHRPVIGDRVMCLKNNRELGLFNGMQGTVTAIAGDEMIFTARHVDYRVRVDLGQFNNPRRPDQRHHCDSGEKVGGMPFDYAYVVTCHKAQGDEWDCVLVLEQHSRAWEHARWAYTAATRARRRLIWVKM